MSFVFVSRHLHFISIVYQHQTITDYTVLEDDETGDFVYADLDDAGKLIPTDEWVGTEEVDDDNDDEEEVPSNVQQFDLTTDNTQPSPGRQRGGRRWRRKNLKAQLENINCEHFLCTQNQDGIDGENNDNPHPLKEIILSNNNNNNNNMGIGNEDYDQAEQQEEQSYMIGHKDKERDGYDRNGDEDDEEINMRRHQRRRELTVGGRTRILKNLVVMFKFEDHTNRPLPSRDDMDLLMNGSKDDCQGTEICGTSGSVKTFYETATHGQLIIESYVADWVTVPYTEEEAADNYYG